MALLGVEAADGADHGSVVAQAQLAAHRERALARDTGANSSRGAPFQMRRTRSAGTKRSRTRKSRVEPLTAMARSVRGASTRSARPW